MLVALCVRRSPLRWGYYSTAPRRLRVAAAHGRVFRYAQAAPRRRRLGSRPSSLGKNSASDDDQPQEAQRSPFDGAQGERKSENPLILSEAKRSRRTFSTRTASAPRSIGGREAREHSRPLFSLL